MDYESLIFGEKPSTPAERSDPNRLGKIIDFTLKDYLDTDDLVLCILEPLEVYKLNAAKYRVFVRARLDTENVKKVGVDFIKMIHEMFDADASISRSRYLYFGDATGEHEIFDAEDLLQIESPTSPLSEWQEALTEPLRWNYAVLDAANRHKIEEKFAIYREGQQKLMQCYFSGSELPKKKSFLYNLLIPAAFQGEEQYNRSKRALGAVFLVLLTTREVPSPLRELLFLRLSMSMYYYHSAEAIDKLIVESGMDRYQRILSMLEMPLANLTTALSEVERDAQELRAILLEPSRGLLAARNRIACFFREGEWLQTPDGGSIRIEHQPHQIEELRHAQWTLVYLLASIRGDKPKIQSSKEALAYEVVFFKEAKESSKSPFQGLALSIDRLLPEGLDSWCSGGLEKINDPVPLKEALASFKVNLFQVLKPDYNGSLTQNHIYTLLGIGERPSSVKVGEVCVVPQLFDPFSSFAHFLEFLGMLVEQHSDFRVFGGNAFNVQVEGCHCNGGSQKSKCFPTTKIVAPDASWINVGKGSRYEDITNLVQDLERMMTDNTTSKTLEVRQLGNFRSSFAYLFSRTNPRPSVHESNSELVCSWGHFEVRFAGKELIIKSLQMQSK